MKNHDTGRSFGRQHFLFMVTAIFLAALLSACSSGLQVRSDIDLEADFSQYTTYNFFEPMGIEGGYNSPIFGEHFRASLGNELSRRGYRTADRPNILINVTIRSDDKVRMRSYTSPYMTGGYYGRPGSAEPATGGGCGTRPADHIAGFGESGWHGDRRWSAGWQRDYALDEDEWAGCCDLW